MNTSSLEQNNKTSNLSDFDKAHAIHLLIEKQKLAILRSLAWQEDFITAGIIARGVQYILTMSASMIIICAIVKYKKLHTPSNLFIAALALGEYWVLCKRWCLPAWHW